MLEAEKSSNALLIGALGTSLLLHVALVISIMTIEIPPHQVSRVEFEKWVQQIERPKREGIFLPEIPKELGGKPMPKGSVHVIESAGAENDIPAEATKAEVPPKEAPAFVPPETKTAKPASKNSVKTAGVLGVIGVASEKGKGGTGGLANVFSKGSGKLSDDLGAVMEGKRRAELPNSVNISRHDLKGSGGDGPGGIGSASGGTADVGPIASVSSGRVDAGSRRDSEIPAHVSLNSGALVSGHMDQYSAISVISRKNNSFTRCYERSLRNNPGLAGRIGYEISVSEEGNVLHVDFIEDTLRDREVRECIKNILMRLAFVKSTGGPAILSSVMVFGTN